MSKPEALRLADALQQQAVWEGHYGPSYLRDLLPEAAAELRRLHEVETLYLAAMRGRHAMSEELLAVTGQRDALLTALRSLLSYANVLEMRLLDADGEHRAMQQARAAIAKAEEQT